MILSYGAFPSQQTTGRRTTSQAPYEQYRSDCHTAYLIITNLEGPTHPYRHNPEAMQRGGRASVWPGHRAYTAMDNSASPRRDRTGREYRYRRTGDTLPVDIDTHHCPPLPVERLPWWNRIVLGDCHRRRRPPRQVPCCWIPQTGLSGSPNVVRSTLRQTNARPSSITFHTKASD